MLSVRVLSLLRKACFKLTDAFSPRLLSSFRSVLLISHCASASAPLHSHPCIYTDESRLVQNVYVVHDVANKRIGLAIPR